VILVGLGTRGQHWAQVIRDSPDCEFVAYVDPDPAALENARERFGRLPIYASLDEALAAEDGVEALVLATPPETREPHIAAACQRQLPLLVEKPLALDLAEAARYVELAEASDTPLMVGLNFRYLPVTQAYRKQLESGAAGEAEFGRFTYERWRNGYRPRLNRYPLEMAQPMLWEQSIHHFDLMRFVYRREPIAVYCRSWNPSWTMYQDDTNISALFEFEGGFEVNYQGTWQSGWEPLGFDWRTDGSEGIVIQRDMFGELFHAKRKETALTPVPLPPFEHWITDTAGLLAAFVRGLRGDPLECSGRDHLRSLAMVEACILSARDGRRVEVAPLLEQLESGAGSPSGQDRSGRE
jgi:predicted dehydrogenase